jgi:hypothetical protein
MKGICSQSDAYRYMYVQYFQSAFAIAIYETLEVTKGFGRCGFPYTFVAYVVGNRDGFGVRTRVSNSALDSDPDSYAVPTAPLVCMIYNKESGYLPQTLLWPSVTTQLA